MPDNLIDAIAEAERRLKAFIREHIRGGCRIISQGDACQCPLCDLDRLLARGLEAERLNYRWERCYELDGELHWAIVDDESASKGCVTSHLLVVTHEWADSLGRPFDQCELPQRIIALLNSDERHFERSVTAMRRYKAPANGRPYSDDGLKDLEDQCHRAARAGDSALLEQAAIVIGRLRSDLALHKQLGDKQALKLARVQSKVAPYRQPGCNSGAHGLANEVYEIVAGEN
jgi:hypothetical protein